jgi:hypothetical protein
MVDTLVFLQKNRRNLFIHQHILTGASRLFTFAAGKKTSHLHAGIFPGSSRGLPKANHKKRAVTFATALFFCLLLVGKHLFMQTLQSIVLDLANPFTGTVELFAQIFQCHHRRTIHAETQFQHLFLLSRKSVKQS